jgi:hypothetical protein
LTSGRWRSQIHATISLISHPFVKRDIRINSVVGFMLYLLRAFPTPNEEEAERTLRAGDVWSSEFLRLYSDHKELIKHRKNSPNFHISSMSELDLQSPKDALLVYAKSRIE